MFKKISALVLSLALSLTMLPAQALAAIEADQADTTFVESHETGDSNSSDAASSNSAMQDNSDEPSVSIESDVDADVPAAEEMDNQISISSNDLTNSDQCLQGNLNDTEYVFLEREEVPSTEKQNIVVGFKDESVNYSDAKLLIRNLYSDKTHEVDFKSLISGAILFEIDPSVLGFGSFEVYALKVLKSADDDGWILYSFNQDDSAEYVFSIVAASEDEFGKTDIEDVSAFVIGDDGELEHSASVEEAIEEAQPDVISESSKARASEGIASRTTNVVVVLDPGHGGNDGGASANGVTEKYVNLKIAQYCKAELDKYVGITTYMTRNDDTYVGIEERVNFAKSKGANVIISFHNDSAGNTSARGASVIIPMSGVENQVGEGLGNTILDHLAAFGLPKRSTWTKEGTGGEDYYGILRYAKRQGFTGIIIEHAFLTNPTDAAILSNESNLQRIGIADATAIAQYFGLSTTISRENAEAFVTRLYEKVLQRSPDASGFEFHVNSLVRGASAADLAKAFFTAAEFEKRNMSDSQRVQIAYQTMLDRNADAGGLSYYAGFLNQKMTIISVIAAFSYSPEFNSLCSRWQLVPGRVNVSEPRDFNYNATAYVNRLYEKVLGRQSDISGLNHHCKSLNSGGSASQLAWTFFSSGEYKGRNHSNDVSVEKVYQTMLNRGSDAGGAAFHKERLDIGMSLMTVISAFSYSPEFRSNCSKWGVNPGVVSVVEPRDYNYNVTAFVNRLYQEVMGRQPDIAGLNHHCKNLNNGSSAAQLAWAFFSAPEFTNKPLSNSEKVEFAYLVMMNRSSDSGGKAYWKFLMDSGMPMYFLIAGFSESAEFKSLCSKYGLNAGPLAYDPAEMSKYSQNRIMGSSPRSIIDNMVRYYQRSGATYPSNVYASKGAPDIRTYATIAYDVATSEGVRPEVLFSQAMKETGWLQFGGIVNPEQCNFGGLGALDGNGNGVAATFPDVRTGLLAQTQHLKLYGSIDPLNNPCVDPRWEAAIYKYGRGAALTVQALGGKWATDASYGDSLYNMVVACRNS